MRNLAAILALTFVALPSLAQGVLIFNNRITGQVDAPVSRCDGTGAGEGVSAQLFLITGSGTSQQYVPLEPATTFRTTSAAAAYYVVQPQSYVVVPGVSGGQQATLVMRAWAGPDYESAIVRGQSNPVTITLGFPFPPSPIPDAVLVGLQGFSLCIPEPSALTLACLGLTAFLYRRPRRLALRLHSERG